MIKMLENYEVIISILEAILESNEPIDFNKKRSQKIVDKNATDLNNMMMSGELNSIRQTPNGNIMGDPTVVKKLKDMKAQSLKAQKDLKECYEDILMMIDKILFEAERPSFTDEKGNTQLQFMTTPLTGRNLQKEQQEEKAQKQAKKNKPKNPNKVAGGKKAYKTKKKNIVNEINNRPIFQALNVAPASANESLFEQIISIIEGELIDFQKKRKEKILDRNLQKMQDMMTNGEMRAVRVLPNNELIGDPTAIKKIKDIEAENREVIQAARKKKI